jgi:hypothetical protein
MIKDFIKGNKYILEGIEGHNTELSGEEYTFDSYSPFDNTYKFTKEKDKNGCKDSCGSCNSPCSPGGWGSINIDWFGDTDNTYVDKNDQDKKWKAYEVS